MPWFFARSMADSTCRTGNIRSGTLRSVSTRAEEALLIVVVVDDEVLAQPDRLAPLAQEARRDRVERPHPQAAAADPHPLPEEPVDPLAQLARRLVGEGDGEDAPRVGARRHQPRQPVGDDPRLARARARDHEQRRPAACSTASSCAGVQLARQHLARERLGARRAFGLNRGFRFHPGATLSHAGATPVGKVHARGRCRPCDLARNPDIPVAPSACWRWWPSWG